MMQRIGSITILMLALGVLAPAAQQQTDPAAQGVSQNAAVNAGVAPAATEVPQPITQAAPLPPPPNRLNQLLPSRLRVPSGKTAIGSPRASRSSDRRCAARSLSPRRTK